ncbi:MAG: thiolase family protein [Desulfatiglans sp.]|jgi:acetyl-CoA C-acetyltransferase|nr:thiolase family protein [Desulfatiglans sp.]
MTNSNDIVIVSAVRTPFSPFGGVLREMHSTDLGALVIKEVLERVDLSGDVVDELYYGMCIQSEAALESNVNGRQALLKAGMPADLISLTIDRACCSSLTAVQLGIRTIIAGDAEVLMAVGAENMSNTPLVMNGHRWGTKLQQPVFKDHLNPIFYTNHNALAKDAGEVALEHGIDREAQDRWALGSQEKYQEAKKLGKFKDELMPVIIPQRKGDPIVFEEDAFPKPHTTMEGLAKLKTVYASPTVTAGNAPGLDAGASAVLFMRRSKAEELGLEPLATILTVKSVAMEPRYMAEAPGYAILKALKKSDMTMSDIDLVEINEAFAAMPLVSTKILAENDMEKWEEIKKITNVNGDAIALGHPVGASGARILMTLMYELRRRGGGLGAAGICGGLAQADAAIIRV